MFFVLNKKKKKKSRIISSFLLTTQQELFGKIIAANAWENPKTIFFFSRW